jgi:hypothetical protein
MEPNVTSADMERFWSHVDTRGGIKACWPWTAAVTNNYGQFSLHGGKLRCYAHRFVAYIFGKVDCVNARDHTRGADLVLHSCDNPRCCNPQHLRTGSALDNSKERDAKGRTGACRGAAQPRSKLTADDVHAIRAAVHGGEMQKNVAQRFGVSRARICMIASGKSWGWLKS